MAIPDRDERRDVMFKKYGVDLDSPLIRGASAPVIKHHLRIALQKKIKGAAGLNSPEI